MDRPLNSPPFPAGHKQLSLSLSHCNDKAVAGAGTGGFVMLEKTNDELQMGEVVKVKKNPQSTPWRGVAADFMISEFI